MSEPTKKQLDQIDRKVGKVVVQVAEITKEFSRLLNREAEAQCLVKDMADLLDDCKGTFIADQHPGVLLARIEAMSERANTYCKEQA